MTQTEIYTVDEIAQRWRCSVDVVYDMLRRKQLRGFKVGNIWRVPARAVTQFEDNA